MKCLFRNRGVLLNYEHDSFYQLGMLNLLDERTRNGHCTINRETSQFSLGS